MPESRQENKQRVKRENTDTRQNFRLLVQNVTKLPDIPDFGRWREQRTKQIEAAISYQKQGWSVKDSILFLCLQVVLCAAVHRIMQRKTKGKSE